MADGNLRFNKRPYFVIMIAFDDHDSYYQANLDTLKKIVECTNDEERRDFAMSGDMAHISSSYDIDLHFDDTGYDEDWWKREGKGEFESFIADNS